MNDEEFVKWYNENIHEYEKQGLTDEQILEKGFYAGMEEEKNDSSEMLLIAYMDGMHSGKNIEKKLKTMDYANKCTNNSKLIFPGKYKPTEHDIKALDENDVKEILVDKIKHKTCHIGIKN